MSLPDAKDYLPIKVVFDGHKYKMTERKEIKYSRDDFIKLAQQIQRDALEAVEKKRRDAWAAVGFPVTPRQITDYQGGYRAALLYMGQEIRALMPEQK